MSKKDMVNHKKGERIIEAKIEGKEANSNSKFYIFIVLLVLIITVLILI